MTASKQHPVPHPQASSRTIVGVLVYPEPGFTISNAIIDDDSELTIAFAAAPTPPPPKIATVGGPHGTGSVLQSPVDPETPSARDANCPTIPLNWSTIPPTCPSKSLGIDCPNDAKLWTWPTIPVTCPTRPPICPWIADTEPTTFEIFPNKSAPPAPGTAGPSWLIVLYDGFFCSSSQEKNFKIPGTKSKEFNNPEPSPSVERALSFPIEAPSWDPRPPICWPTSPREPATPLSWSKTPETEPVTSAILPTKLPSVGTAESNKFEAIEVIPVTPLKRALIGTKIELRPPVSVARIGFKISLIKFWDEQDGAVTNLSKMPPRSPPINPCKPPTIFLKMQEILSNALFTLSYSFGISLGNRNGAIFFIFALNLSKIKDLTPPKIFLVNFAISFDAPLSAFWIFSKNVGSPWVDVGSLYSFFNAWITFKKFFIVKLIPSIEEFPDLETSNRATGLILSLIAFAVDSTFPWTKSKVDNGASPILQKSGTLLGFVPSL